MSDIPKGCKPFDLARALAGDKVVARDGSEVTQLVRFNDVHGHSLVGVKNNQIYRWSDSGPYYVSQHAFDLFMAKKTKMIKLRFYKNGLGYLTCMWSNECDLGDTTTNWVSDVVEIEVDDE